MSEKTVENLLNILEECGPNSRIAFGQDLQFKEFCDKVRRKKRLAIDWNLLPLDVTKCHASPKFSPVEIRLLTFLERSPNIFQINDTSRNECRFCLITDMNDMVCLSELDAGVLDVAQQFFQIKIFDGFSQHVCFACLNILKSFQEFNEKCKSSNLILLNLAFEEICSNNKSYITKFVPISEETNDLLLLSNVSEAKSQMEEYSATENDVSNYDHDTGNIEETYDKGALKSSVKQTKITDIKKHICDYCSKRFRTKLNLKVHIRSHTNERPFICPEECGKSFKTYSAVNNHRAAHSTDKKFECPVSECSYRTTTKANLNIHGRTHTQERFVVYIFS